MNHPEGIPKIIEKSPAEIALAISAVEGSHLPDDVKTLCIASIQLNAWIPQALLQKEITIALLRKLIFGSSPRTRNRKMPGELGKKTPEIQQNHTSPKSSESEKTEEKPNKKHGHGRTPHHAYRGATEHHLKIHDKTAGDRCDCGGKWYSISSGMLIRIKGQNVAAVHKYSVEKLRCASCSQIASATIPEHVGSEKYDASFKAIVALQKYYMAVPFYRQAYFQGTLHTPLPASTQWDLVQQVGGCVLPIFSVLEKIAANSKIAHVDDSHVKIINVFRDEKENGRKERTGTFTTGFICRTNERDIALFYNGTKHAGENMEKLLRKRHADAHPMIQMCDASSRNIPKSFKTILCNCLSHGFRKFDDLKEFYPTHCLRIIALIAKIYEQDEKTRTMTHAERLTHHQMHSQPIVDQLHHDLTALLEEKRVEPNDALGSAIRYMLKHWEPLTQFLRTPGAPLDNNLVERALKIPIRGRRTWLFYKSEYGAMIGSVLTSVIYTCVLSKINPLDYLVALQRHKKQVILDPEKWLPWNYLENEASLSNAA